jgi:hypothetical protein
MHPIAMVAMMEISITILPQDVLLQAHRFFNPLAGLFPNRLLRTLDVAFSVLRIEIKTADENSSYG